MKRLILPLMMLGLVMACNESTTDTSAANPQDGEGLSKVYCGSCHIYPEPGVLDKQTWEHFVLVRMAAFMGIYYDGIQYYDQLPEEWIEPGLGGQLVREAKVYPDQPMLSREEWEKIRDYYLTNAPDQLQPAATYSVHPELPQFQAHPLLKAGFYAPYTQAVAMDTVNSQILVSLFQQDVIRIDTQGTVLDALGYNEVVTSIDLDESGLTLTAMGDRNGIDLPSGWVIKGKSLKNFLQNDPIFSLDSLQRPISTAWADFDQDGKEEAVVAAFGNYTGKLLLLDQDGSQNVSQQVLYPDDGSLKVIAHDMNDDGWMDIVVLMGNGDEGIDVYLNQGESKFERKRLLRFPSTYGSTDFELIDFDKDGDQDLLYINGDNGDYPPILKPHHGIRLFTNDGSMNFRESFYLPLNGGYQVRAGDFDLDGDMDIVSVAYHPDYSNPPTESFVYWEQKEPGSFTASTFEGFDNARWMRLEVGDLDRDGDLDILLGAFNATSQDVPQELIQLWQQESIPVLWLENGKLDAGH